MNHSEHDASNGVSMNGSDESRIQVELFVKAGSNGESYGGCPMCQRFFMLLLTKAEFNKSIYLVVTTVNSARPPAEFKRLASSRLPALGYNSEIYSDQDEMLQQIALLSHYPPMNYDSVDAANACKDFFSKFSFYIKTVHDSPQPLLHELFKLDAFLQKSQHKFLNRDIPDHLDCITLPKLQHVRVAGLAFKDFEFPVEMKGLWRYLYNAYQNVAFKESCPSDQEIVYHWRSKPECSPLSKEKISFYSPDGKPKYSFGIPPDIL